MSSPGQLNQYPGQEQQQQQSPVVTQNYNDPVPPKKGFLDFAYFKTIFFIIKVALVILLIAGAISVSVKYGAWGTSRYYNFCAITGIVVAVIFTLLNLFRITEKISKVPWNFIEMVFDVIWAILLLIASAILTDYARKYQEMDSYAAGAFFGYASLLLYLVDAAFRFIAFQRGGMRLSKSKSTAATQANAPPS